MKILIALLVIGVVLAVIVASLRAGKRDNGPYRRRFDSQLPNKGTDSSFLYTGAIMGADHHQPIQGADCTPGSDGGASCSDGGGGGGSGGSD